jgi:hypothetical protein
MPSHWAWWLTHVIPDTQEVEIRRIVVQGQSGQKVSKTFPPHPYKYLLSQLFWKPK